MPESKMTKVPNEIDALARTLLSTSDNALLIESHTLPRNDFYRSLRSNLPVDKQILFLVPETDYAEKLKSDFSVFHGNLKASEKSAIVNGIRTGEINAVIGTRSALFLPFKNLGAIVLDFEHNENYCEKRTPKYHAFDVARELAGLLQIPFIVISAAPRTETWYAAKTLKFKIHEWLSGKKPTVRLVNMTDERSRKNWGIFAEETIEKTARALAQNQQVLFFINRKGSAAALVCKDCGHLFSCSSCGNTFAVHEGSILLCHVCGAKQPVPAKCPSCGNVRLKEIGLGTEKIFSEISKVFGKADVVRIDQSSKFILKEKHAEQCDILVATSIIEKPLNLPRLTLSVAIQPDSMLQFSNFRSSEKTLQTLTHVRNLTNLDGEMIIQTFLPEHHVFKAIAKNSLTEFYEEELRSREALSLPPFSPRPHNR